MSSDPAATPDVRLQEFVLSLGHRLDALEALGHRLEALEHSSAPSLASVSAPAPKVPFPDKFDGNIARFKDFVVSVENVFALQPSRYPNDETKTRFIGTLLSKDALAWFREILKHEQQKLLNYAEFMTEFADLFDDPHSQKHAQASLKRLRQGRFSVLAYSARFRRLAKETGFNDEALIDIYRTGLNDDVKDVLATSLVEPEKLEDYIHFCTKIDHRLADRRAERTRRPGAPSNRPPAPLPVPVTPVTQGPTPMDLDAMNAATGSSSSGSAASNPRKLTKEERERRLKENLCLYCGAAGHRAFGCPKKSKN